MKTTVPYNFKKGLVFLGLMALPFAFAGCEKENVEPNRGNRNSGNTENPDTPKHNVELKYDGRTDEGCVNVAMDTIYKYNADLTVDTIFMVPEPTNQFATWGTTQIQSVANYLRPRHNVNPNKVFGKGELILWEGATRNNPELLRFFVDTLKYNVKLREL